MQHNETVLQVAVYVKTSDIIAPCESHRRYGPNNLVLFKKDALQDFQLSETSEMVPHLFYRPTKLFNMTA